MAQNRWPHHQWLCCWFWLRINWKISCKDGIALHCIALTFNESQWTRNEWNTVESSLRRGKGSLNAVLPEFSNWCFATAGVCMRVYVARTHQCSKNIGFQKVHKQHIHQHFICPTNKCFKMSQFLFYSIFTFIIICTCEYFAFL